METNNTLTVSALFENATRNKLRFTSVKGQLTVEDLWDLPLTKLDEMAVAIYNSLEGVNRKSFIGRSDPKNSENTDKLEILKRVLEVKQFESEQKRLLTEKRQQKEFLVELLNKKKMAQLESMPMEDIQKQLDALGAV